jgi:hypothetical protein
LTNHEEGFETTGPPDEGRRELASQDISQLLVVGAAAAIIAALVALVVAAVIFMILDGP